MLLLSRLSLSLGLFQLLGSELLQFFTTDLGSTWINDIDVVEATNTVFVTLGLRLAKILTAVGLFGVGATFQIVT